MPAGRDESPPDGVWVTDAFYDEYLRFQSRLVRHMQRVLLPAGGPGRNHLVASIEDSYGAVSKAELERLLASLSPSDRADYMYKIRRGYDAIEREHERVTAHLRRLGATETARRDEPQPRGEIAGSDS